jgi:hypothetical protein
MIRRTVLAGLLAGCAHPLPPRSPPGPRGAGSAATPRATPPRTLSGVQAPAPALPGATPDPGPDLHFAPIPDPANPYPAPDPALPPDARAT